jgi:hypothetical protein
MERDGSGAIPLLKGHVMRLVVMCCLCEKVYDDMEKEVGKARWKDQHWFMAKYQLKRTDIRVTHGYCPNCLQSYRTFLALPQDRRGASQKENKS